MENERISFGFVKPHAYQWKDEIERMIRESGLSIPVKKDPYYFSREKAESQYRMHMGKPFFDALVEEILSGATDLLIVEGDDAIQRLIKLTGDTDPNLAEKGTIRERFGKRDNPMYNAFHRADSRESAKEEIFLHFDMEELPRYIAEFLQEY